MVSCPLPPPSDSRLKGSCTDATCSRDIVDTRDINGDVYSMFLAALTQDNDDNNLSHRVSTTLI